MGSLNVPGVVFKHAVRQGYVSHNPVSQLADERPPAKNKTKARVLTAEQVADLIRHTDSGYRPLIASAVYTAMRQSELLGLQWRDMDFAAEQITVRHQLSRATRQESARLIPLKTDAAERETELAPDLANVSARTSPPPATPATMTSSSPLRPGSRSATATPANGASPAQPNVPD